MSESLEVRVYVCGWRVGTIWKGECEEVWGSAGVSFFFFFPSPITQLSCV